MSVKIELADVVRSGPPTLDRNGIVFEHAGRLYRALRPGAASLYRQLLDADWLEDLFDAGLVRFTRTDVTLPGFDLVLEVERVPTVTYPPEWPTAMLRAAGERIAVLGHRLALHGLALSDAHPWNVLFDGPKSVFIDLGSIVAGTGVVPVGWIHEFRRYVVLPLALHRARFHQLADAVQRQQRGGWTDRLDRRFARPFPIAYRRLQLRQRDPVAFFAGLADYMRSNGAAAASTRWSTYYVADDPEVGETDRYNDKQRSVDTLLRGLTPATVLDAGANEGWYSRLAASHGHHVVALDLDDRSLSALFLRARHEDLQVIPLRMDLMWPPGTSGLALEYRSAPERLRSDTVLALAILHHLAGPQGISFGAFARAMDLFAERRAIVEFIPSTDEHVAKWPLASESWYSTESLVDAMRPFFELTDVLPSHPAPRTILVFERPERIGSD